jgi:hypothetical protein
MVAGGQDLQQMVFFYLRPSILKKKRKQTCQAASLSHTPAKPTLVEDGGPH